MSEPKMTLAEWEALAAAKGKAGGDGQTERVRRILTFKKAKTAYLQMEGDIAGAKSVEGL